MDRRVIYDSATQLIRFGLVGVTSTLIYFASYWLTGFVGELPAWLRGAISFCPSIAANYTLQRSFTFKSQRSHAHAGPRHLTVQLGSMALNSAFLWVLVDTLRLPYWPSQLSAFVVMTACSYVGQRYWAFRDETSPPR
jgi:putative flippase GtrA